MVPFSSSQPSLSLRSKKLCVPQNEESSVLDACSLSPGRHHPCLSSGAMPSQFPPSCDSGPTACALCGDQKVHWICLQATGRRGPGISLSHRQGWTSSQIFMYLVPYLLVFQKAERESKEVTNSCVLQIARYQSNCSGSQWFLPFHYPTVWRSQELRASVQTDAFHRGPPYLCRDTRQLYPHGAIYPCPCPFAQTQEMPDKAGSVYRLS